MTVDPTIIVALISLSGIIISAMITRNNLSHELDKRMTLVEDKLHDVDEHFREVNHKLEVHNSYQEKFVTLSSDIKLIQKDINYIKDNK